MSVKSTYKNLISEIIKSIESKTKLGMLVFSRNGSTMFSRNQPFPTSIYAADVVAPSATFGAGNYV